MLPSYHEYILNGCLIGEFDELVTQCSKCQSLYAWIGLTVLESHNIAYFIICNNCGSQELLCVKPNSQCTPRAPKIISKSVT